MGEIIHPAPVQLIMDFDGGEEPPSSTAQEPSEAEPQVWFFHEGTVVRPAWSHANPHRIQGNSHVAHGELLAAHELPDHPDVHGLRAHIALNTVHIFQPGGAGFLTLAEGVIFGGRVSERRKTE